MSPCRVVYDSTSQIDILETIKRGQSTLLKLERPSEASRIAEISVVFPPALADSSLLASEKNERGKERRVFQLQRTLKDRER